MEECISYLKACFFLAVGYGVLFRISFWFARRWVRTIVFDFLFSSVPSEYSGRLFSHNLVFYRWQRQSVYTTVARMPVFVVLRVSWDFPRKPVLHIVGMYVVKGRYSYSCGFCFVWSRLPVIWVSVIKTCRHHLCPCLAVRRNGHR